MGEEKNFLMKIPMTKELLKMENLGRKCALDEIKKATFAIMENVKE